MSAETRTLAARLRTLFAPGRMTRRYADGRVQVETHNGRVAEGREAFAYGFRSCAKEGRALTLCQGGDPGATVILPILGDSGAPELKAGDSAVYAEGGSKVVARDAGGVDVCGASGKLLLANDAANLCDVLVGLIDEVAALRTFGSAPSHDVDPASRLRLENYKSVVRTLLKEGK